jgi:peptide/nickel transport system substrate-binding protein
MNYWERKHFSRRRVLAAGGVGAAGLMSAAIIGCGDDDSSGSAPGTATTGPTTAATVAKDAPRKGGTFASYNLNATTDNLDIQQSSHPGVQAYAQFTNDGLMILDEPKPGAFEQKPQLIESWEQPDTTTIVLHVRKGVKFANVPPVNGRVMTAADVVFSLKRMATDSAKYPRRTWFTQVDSIEATDANTVRIKTKRPYAALLYLLASPWVVVISPEQVAQDGDQLKGLIGTGPYIAKKIDIGSEFFFERNPDYWDTGKPYIDSWRFLNIVGVAAQLAAFRAGETQYADPGTDLLDKFRSENPGTNEWIGPRVGIGITAFNNRKAPFSDMRVRQAIANAVDLKGWIDALVKGDGQQTGPMYAAYTNWSLPPDKLLYTKPDVKKAKDLMKAAGLEAGFKASTITLGSPIYEGQAIQLKEDLRQLNIDVSIEVVETPDYTRRAFVEHDFDMVSGQDFSADDPDQLGDRFISTSPQNWSGYANKTVDQLFSDQSQETDPKKRRAIVDKIQATMMDEVPMLFTFISNGHYFYPGKARGYRRSPLNANAERLEARGLYYTA